MANLCSRLSLGKIYLFDPRPYRCWHIGVGIGAIDPNIYLGGAFLALDDSVPNL